MGTLSASAAACTSSSARDFVAVVQLLIYVGGILVLTPLSRIMLTHQIVASGRSRTARSGRCPRSR
jgi:NADH:ubiquinone oxidoreductase subunit 6 (subunit J)